MNLKLEDFLEEAFAPVQPSAQGVGRVVVEPDYEIDFVREDAPTLAAELSQCVRNQKTDLLVLQSPDGFEAEISDRYSRLKKYARRITLHADSAPGPWVEVAPPGNWI